MASDLCDAPATTKEWAHWAWPGYTHSAVFPGLQAGERYRYVVGTGKPPTGTGTDLDEDAARLAAQSEPLEFFAPGAAPRWSTRP